MISLIFVFVFIILSTILIYFYDKDESKFYSWLGIGEIFSTIIAIRIAYLVYIDPIMAKFIATLFIILWVGYNIKEMFRMFKLAKESKK